MKVSKGTKLFALGVLLVVIDQIIKILVKTNMQIGEHFNVIGNWFQIFFIENEGMAFGMKFGGMAGKFCLSLFRIILFGLLFWWISSLSRKSVTPDGGKALLPDGKTPVVPTGVLVGLTLIAAGAMGNLIDCLFYGLIFDYAPFMFGRVVDMLYFPLIDTIWPTWMPFVGGERFLFFAPIFNFADSCVTVGAIYLLIFHYWPMYGAQIAFRDYRARDGITGSQWVGLKWFEKFLSDFQTGIFYWSFSWKCFHTASAALRGTTAARVSTSASLMAFMVPNRFRKSSRRLGPTPGMPSSADFMVLLVWLSWW